MKETKRALILSGISLALCIVLIAGMTFAWFTDSVVNKGNNIVTGTLSVDLLLDKEKNGTYSTIANKEGSIFSDQKGGNGYNWEPGQTEIVYLAVKNNGQLNVKYNIDLDITGELAGALEYVLISDVKASEKINTWEDAKNASGGQPGSAGENIKFKVDKVIPAAQSGDAMSYFAIAVHMKEDAGNNVQGKSVTVNLAVNATQASGEADGFENSQYDESATTWFTSVNDAPQLKRALDEGGTVNIERDIAVTGETAGDKNIITQDTVVNFGSNTVSLNIPNAVKDTPNWKGIEVAGGKSVFNGSDGGVETSPNAWLYAVYVNGGSTLTINGGKYIGGTSAVHVNKGNVEINGGFFKGRALNDDSESTSPFTLNCNDDNYKNGTASIKVKGGTFVNFNPADNRCEGEHTNYVLDGYKVLSEKQNNGDIWYTVVKK